MRKRVLIACLGVAALVGVLAAASIAGSWQSTKNADRSLETAAEVDVTLRRRLAGGESVEVVCTVLKALGAETDGLLGDGGKLVAIFRNRGGGTFIAHEIVVRAYFDSAGKLDRWKCEDRYTGP